MKAKEFIIRFGEEVTKLIKYFEQFKELTGEQKKQRVIELLEDWFKATIEQLPINFALKFIIKKLVLTFLPDIVQLAFNLLQTKIEGITK